MARKPRFNLPGIPQHVIQRGNNRAPCFFTDADYRFYLDHLRRASEKTDCMIHAYVLMTNHVHLLVTPARPFSVSDMMQSLGRRYVRYINQTYERTGTLWEGRYRASLVDSERYVLVCYRYIELNPVRAGMTQSAGEYHWSSHRATALGALDGVITAHDAYLRLGENDEARQRAYLALFHHQRNNSELDEIRSALNQELVLGSERFKDEIDLMVSRQVRPGIPGRPKLPDGLSGEY
jgi:REP-associated tyrosine transposase